MSGSELLVDAIDANKLINFKYVISCVGIYLVLFWFGICYWVYTDAKKRYQNTKTAIVIAIGVFLFQFPSLILYLIIRKPYHEDHLEFLDMEQGVNIPLVNFTGDKGVQMTLELNINPRTMNNSDMKVNVDWTSKNENFKVQTIEVKEPSETIEEDELEERSKIKDMITSLSALPGRLKVAITTRMESMKKKPEQVEEKKDEEKKEEKKGD